MKNAHLLFVKLSMILIAVSLVSCKKDSTIIDAGSTGFRLISIKDVSLKDGSQTLTNFEYLNDKVYKAKAVYKNGSDEYYFDYTTTNKVVINHREGSYTDRSDLIFSNGKLSEVLEGNLISKLSYNGIGSLEKIEDYDNGVLSEVFNFLYTSGKLSEANYVSKGVKYIQITLSYNGENISERINYRDGQVISKDVYTYSSGKISRIQEKGFLNNAWVNSGVSDFRYDLDGNLIEDTYTDLNYGYNYQISYTYEKGNGNLRSILGGTYNYYDGMDILFNLRPFPF